MAEDAILDIEFQVPNSRLDGFRRHDLSPALEALASDSFAWMSYGIAHGPGWRVSLDGNVVAGFHLFITDDMVDPRPNALVVYAVDIWLDTFPDEPAG